MGPALNTAASMNAYILADRGTWLSFKNRADLTVSVEGDKRLFNQYGVILVNPDKHAHVKKADGQAFIDWVVSAEGQSAIADYRIDGQQLFFPNAAKYHATRLPPTWRRSRFQPRPASVSPAGMYSALTQPV
jgi:tungstate transport system substrate-binding protein